MRRLQLTLAVLAVLTVGPLTQVAHAHGGFGVRIGIGLPGFYVPGPYYYGGYPYAYPYYYPPPAYVYPAPAVVVQPAPAPVVVRQPGAIEAVPNAAEPPTATPSTFATTTPPANVVPVRNDAPSGARMDALLQQMSDASETVRKDAAMDLGRMKAQRAVEPLMTMLAKDSSTAVRESAARALGLIASPKSLNALIYAAQADNDREVRRSAQFAVEVIRSNLRGQY